ncbi:hypothetical protein PRIPAC_86489, partial [Pristionchus pacificus]
DMDDDDNRPSTPKLNLGEVSRSSSPVVTTTTSYPVSVRQQMARIKQMEQPSPSGSTDGGELLASPLTPGGVTPGGAPSTGPGRRKAPKVHRRNGRGETPLHVAAKKGDVSTCEQLVADGAEVNQSDNAGWTPLHEAASNNRVDCVDFLLKNGANPNARSQFGDVPLHDAVHCNYVRLVWTLLRAGAAIDEKCLDNNLENQRKDEQKERAGKINWLLHNPSNLPQVCPESEEEEDSEEEKKKEKEREEKESGKEKKDKRKKKDKEEKKKHKETFSSTPLRAPPSDKYAPPSSTSSRTTVTTAATTVFESPLHPGGSGVVGGGSSAAALHSPSMAKASELQQLSVATEQSSERRTDDLPSSSRSSIPATTPISVIVEGGEEEEEDGEIKSDGGGGTDEKNEGTPVASSSLLTIADDVIDDDDDEEGKLMIDEGDEEEKEGKEQEDEEETTLDTPIVNVQPPTPIGDRRMELAEREGENERDSATRDSDPIEEGEETSGKDHPSSSRAYSEDPPSSATASAKKRKKAGDRSNRKSEKAASKRAATGIGAWAKNRGSAEPEMSSAAAAAAAAMMAPGGDDPFEFHDSSPDSRPSRGVTMDRELSAPPVPKRHRLSTQSPTPSAGDVEMEEEDDEETRQSAGSKKVPPLRLVLPPKQSDDGDGADDVIASSSHSTPIPSSQPRKQGRGRPAGGRRAGDDEGSAQRMTRSKVRQSGRGLDESEGGGKRKRGRQNLTAVIEEETAGEEGEGDYSTGATPLMGGAAMGEGGEMIGGGGGDLDWMAAVAPLTASSSLENAIYEITTQSTHMARANLDALVNKHVADLYQKDRTVQWEPSELQQDTFLTYNGQYSIASRPPPPGGWPPMVSAQEVAEAAAAAARAAKAAEEGEQSEDPSAAAAAETAAPSTSAANNAAEPVEVKRNPFELMDERMRPLWEKLKEERALEELQMEEDRVTLRLSIEKAVITRERTMKNLLNQLTFCKFLELKQTCNPHSLLDKQRLPVVEKDVGRFMAHQETRIEELWKRHRFRAGHVAGMQIAKWRETAMALEVKRGLKRQCRAFPEIVPIRVPIPPISDYTLPKPTNENKEEETTPEAVTAQ